MAQRSRSNDSQATRKPPSRFDTWLSHAKRTFLLGWLVIAGTAVVLELAGPNLLGPLTTVVDAIAPSASLGLRITLQIALLLVIPMAAGALAEFVIRLFQGNRNARVLQTMQNKLFGENGAHSSGSYPVVLVDYPRPDLRSFAVVTAKLKEAESGRELAAIYLPKTPEPTSGALRIVAVEDLTMTGWVVEDLVTFHLTFGTAAPESC